MVCPELIAWLLILVTAGGGPSMSLSFAVTAMTTVESSSVVAWSSTSVAGLSTAVTWTVAVATLEVPPSPSVSVK